MPRREAELLRRPQGERRARHAGGPGAQRPGARRRAPAACAWIPTARSSATVTSCTWSAACTASSRRARCLRPVRGRLPGRHAGRRAQGARHADHRRARAGESRPLRRHGRLLRRARRHGPGHHDPHAGIPRRRIQLPGRRRHRRRQRAGERARGSARQERARWCARSSWPRRGCEPRSAADRQLRLLHLQPGAGVPGAGGGGERVSQRRDHPACRRSALDAHAPVHLAGPGHAVRRRRLDGHDPRLRRARSRCWAYAWGISRIVEVFGGKVVRAGA